jgi:hypothetical protein
VYGSDPGGPAEVAVEGDDAVDDADHDRGGAGDRDGLDDVIRDLLFPSLIRDGRGW